MAWPSNWTTAQAMACIVYGEPPPAALQKRTPFDPSECTFKTTNGPAGSSSAETSLNNIVPNAKGPSSDEPVRKSLRRSSIAKGQALQQKLKSRVKMAEVVSLKLKRTSGLSHRFPHYKVVKPDSLGSNERKKAKTGFFCDLRNYKPCSKLSRQARCTFLDAEIKKMELAVAEATLKLNQMRQVQEHDV